MASWDQFVTLIAQFVICVVAVCFSAVVIKSTVDQFRKKDQ